jgi:hypothetical protein
MKVFVVGMPTMAVIQFVFSNLDDGGPSWPAAIKALVFGTLMGGFAAFASVRTARSERATVDPPAGADAERALARALRTGSLPDDPRLTESLRRLVALRRKGNGGRPLIVPLGMGVGAAALAAGAALRGSAAFAFDAVLLAVVAAPVYLLLVRQFRRFDELDAALLANRGTGPPSAAAE